jgi:hypothetical protein
MTSGGAARPLQVTFARQLTVGGSMSRESVGSVLPSLEVSGVA